MVRCTQYKYPAFLQFKAEVGGLGKLFDVGFALLQGSNGLLCIRVVKDDQRRALCPMFAASNAFRHSVGTNPGSIALKVSITGLSTNRAGPIPRVAGG